SAVFLPRLDPRAQIGRPHHHRQSWSNARLTPSDNRLRLAVLPFPSYRAFACSGVADQHDRRLLGEKALDVVVLTLAGCGAKSFRLGEGLVALEHLVERHLLSRSASM